ncbi:Calx-beta domain-containing protein, partial [Runella salmonicolor]
VVVNGDLKVEPNETFTVPLSSVVASGRNVVISGPSGTGTGTITNDDAATISINDVTQVEGNAGTITFTFNVTLSQVVSSAVTVDFATANGTANAGGDYTPNSGTLTFPANGAGQTQTVSVSVLGDVVGEANETFFVNLTNIMGAADVTFADNQGLGTIQDDDLSFSISDATILEGNSGTTTLTFTVTRNSTATAETIDYQTADNTATTADNDYVAKNGTLTFAVGDASEDIVITLNGDLKVEPNETFFVNLSNLSNGSISDGQGQGTITNDDAAVVTLSGGTAKNEGAAGTTSYTFTATLNNPVQGGLSVAYTTTNGTASTADNDYTDNDGTLTFTGTSGEQKTITVLVNGDNKVELDEAFTVALGAITLAPVEVTTAGSPQTGTITNDDAATVALVGNVSQSEAITPQVFSVSLSNPVDVAVTVNFSTTDGTATTADNDYTGITNQVVTFAAGTTTAQTVNVTVVNDAKVEANEGFNVGLSSLVASGRNVILGTSTGTGTIQNDDAATVTLSIPSTPYLQNEGNSGTTAYVFTATLNNPVQGGFQVAYTTNDGLAIAPEDYTDNDGSLSFAGTAGEMKTITVLANGDLKVEANEDFTVALGAITGAPAGVTVVGSPKQAVITNDELDFGDAPDTYNTLLGNNGARHNTSIAFHLGATVDGDVDGQPTPTGNGDDIDAEGDDDDGVTLPSAFITGTTANITVNASGAGFLNAWVDFNNDGDFGDMGEQVFTNQALATGDNNLTIAVPSGAVPALTFARFRYTTATVMTPSFVGLQTTGEVEDYQVNILNTQFSVSSPTVAEGNASTTSLTFVISRTNNANAASVDYAITGGTASSGTDYVALASGTANFTAGGALTQNVTVTVNGDLMVEDNETVILTLSNPVGGGISTATGTGSITNDDAATLTLSGGTAKNEGLSGTVSYTFTATLSAAVQGGFGAPYTTTNGTATVADNDYVDNDGNLSFAGTSGEQKTITVLVNGDNKVELDETFTVALGALTGLTPVQLAAITTTDSPQTGTITNDDAATVALVGNISELESTTPQTFSVSLSNPVDANVTVNFSTSDSTATTADNDYTGITNQTVTFMAGSTSAQTVNVSITNDTKVEINEVYKVALTNLAASGRNVILGTSIGRGNIQNDDGATLTLSGGTSKAEGNSGTTSFIFTATLNNAVQGGFSVAYTTNDSTATVADNDYTDNDGTLTFVGTAGETKDITVLVKGDSKVEANEAFKVILGALSGTVLDASIARKDTIQIGDITNDEIDFGDAPASYGTLTANNGARHATLLGMYLGTAIDGDEDGQPTATANGDDTDTDGDDEDGVTFPNFLLTGTSTSVTVTASVAGKLDAWIDFNQDGDFDDIGERIANTLSLTAGSNQVNFSVPVGSPDGNAPARFRFSSAGGLNATGLAPDGEVEDYVAAVINTLRIYVNAANVNPSQDGSTWAKAFSNLQSGLNAAATSMFPDIEIWVAQGTYKPGTLRSDVFKIPSKVRVYGGFVGTEINLSERNWVTHPVILSGEIGTIQRNDNSYHVVLFKSTDSLTRLDGFRIERGFAEFVAGTQNINVPDLLASGGGILAIEKSKGLITNCVITDNRAIGGGGMLLRDSSQLAITKTIIYGNEATFGGGVYVLGGSKPYFENVLMVINKGLGGGMYVNGSQPSLMNCTIASNKDDGNNAGGIFNANSLTTVKNSILWGNTAPQSTTGSVITYSTVEGGFSGVGNSNLNPLFVNANPVGLAPLGTLGDYHLQICSPAINGGDNAGAPNEDLEGNVRPFPVGLGIVDRGVFESQSSGSSGPANLTVTEPITSGTVLKVADKIVATNQVSGATVVYQAGKSVTLLPGFTATVGEGNSFQALIGGCDK